MLFTAPAYVTLHNSACFAAPKWPKKSNLNHTIAEHRNLITNVFLHLLLVLETYINDKCSIDLAVGLMCLSFPFLQSPVEFHQVLCH